MHTPLRIGALLAAAMLLPSAVQAGDQCASPPAGMTAWLPFDGDARDRLHRHDGTPLGNPAFTSGHVRGAVAFDSDGDAVRIPHAPDLDVNAPGFTVEFWMRGDRSQPQAQYLVVDKSHGWVDSTGWLFQGFSSSGVLYFGIGAGGPGTTNFPAVPSTAGLLDGSYHHVAGTWNGTRIELFVDGRSQGTTALSKPANNTRPVLVGYSWGGPFGIRRFFRGRVDELSIYGRALSAAEIAAIAGAGTAGKCQPAASCVFRNGRGINPSGYACTTKPALGTTWKTTIATGPATVMTIQVLAARAGQVPFLGGELLIDAAAPFVLVNASGSHAVPLPTSVWLAGAVLPTQGLRVDTVRGAPTLVLLNAQDARLGF